MLVTGACILDLASYDQSLGSLNGDGRVSLGGATLTTGAVGTDALFSGTLDGTGALVKTGAGRLDLTGDSPFAGSVTWADGRLRVSGNLGAADVGVGSDATIEGTGTLGGLSIRGGGRAAPGYDGIGLGALDLRIGGLYGVSDTETRRDNAFASFRDTARATYGGSIAQGFGEIGYRMDLAGA